jgi:hypothetical protein
MLRNGATWLEPISTLLLRRRVAKKRGDGLMALFGYPVARENSAERAVRVALSIQRALAELNRKNEGANKPALAARTAIEMGPVATGSEDVAERFAARYGMWIGSFVRDEPERMPTLSAGFLRDAAPNLGSLEYVMGHRIVGMNSPQLNASPARPKPR